MKKIITERNETNNRIPTLSTKILYIMTNKLHIILYSLQHLYTTLIKSNHRLLKFNTLNRLVERYNTIICANFFINIFISKI